MLLFDYASNPESVDTSYLIQQLGRLAPNERLQLLSRQSNRGDEAALRTTADRGDLPLIQALLNGLTPDQKFVLLTAHDDNGRTALHWATAKGHLSVVNYILMSVSPKHQYILLQLKNCNGRTPLHWASFRGYVEIVRCLLRCLPNQQRLELALMQSNNGGTALHWAADGGQSEVITVILSSLSPQQQETLLNVRDREKDGVTALECATAANYSEVISSLRVLVVFTNGK